MPIISARDNKNNRWKRNAEKATTRKTKKNKGDKSYNERVRAKWFCRVFKLGFLQLICKAFLISKSNLELTLSIFQKKEHYRVKACCGGVQMLKNMRHVILFDMFFNPSFKMTTSFTNIPRTRGRSRDCEKRGRSMLTTMVGQQRKF